MRYNAASVTSFLPSEIDRRFWGQKSVHCESEPKQSVMYKLHSPTIGIVNSGDKRVAITVPADAVIETLSEDLENGIVEVVWDGRSIRMFAVDLHERGEVVAREAQKVDSASASKAKSAS